MYKNSLNNIFPKSLFIVDKLNQNLRNGYFLHPKITKTEKNIKNVYYGVSPFIKLKNRKLLNLKLKKKTNISLFLSNSSKTQKYIEILKQLEKFSNRINKVFLIYNKEIVNFKFLEKNKKDKINKYWVYKSIAENL